MKKGTKLLLLQVLIPAIILTAAPCTFSADDKAICEQCEEILLETDVVYNETGEAMCIYCDEILNQEILKRIFVNQDDMQDEDGEICPECENVIPYGDAEYDNAGEIICPYCTQEDEYETDDPEQEVDGDGFTEIVLNASQWAQAEVSAAYEKGLIPSEMIEIALSTDVTREQFAAIAVKLYEKITEKSVSRSAEGIPFADCSKTSDYIGYVAAAYHLGITNGISSTSFAPQQVISREQLATMLFRVVAKAQAEGAVPKSQITDTVVFADDTLISDYAKESVYYMASRGIIKGMSETTFVPAGVATKEQAIIISNRITDTLY